MQALRHEVVVANLVLFRCRVIIIILVLRLIALFKKSHLLHVLLLNQIESWYATTIQALLLLLIMVVAVASQLELLIVNVLLFI